jgi:hypothetical protein
MEFTISFAVFTLWMTCTGALLWLKLLGTDYDETFFSADGTGSTIVAEIPKRPLFESLY